MKKKTVGIIVAVLVLALAGGIGWQQHNPAQIRLLRAAEDIVFTDADSATRLLAQVDTTRLTESSRMLYDLLRGMVYEEQRYLRYADTASCLFLTDSTIYTSDAKHLPHNESMPVWSFRRHIVYNTADNRAFPDDSTLLRVYHYYERESLGGTSNDKEALRRFGRISFVLSRTHDGHKVSTDKLFHLAMHCAEACDDHELAIRAYDRFTDYLEFTNIGNGELQGWCLRQALEHYRLSHGSVRWLLTLLNNYGYAVLQCVPFDLHHFPSLKRITDIVARHLEEQPTDAVCDSVFLCLDSLYALPAPNFSFVRFYRRSSDDRKDDYVREISVPIDTYEEAQQRYEESGENERHQYDLKEQQLTQAFAVSRDTYLAPGYVMKASQFQKRLQLAVIIILVLAVLVLILLFWNWRNRIRQRHEQERETHQREAEQLAERLRQKDSMIAILRGHIMDKSEILDMLEPTAGKRTIINARNWREIEMTLNTLDGNFVSRLRSEHPQFSEDDIRLCMLTRLQLSNTALSAIYVISVSAVQHRKQKLKKEGFGVNDPNVTFDQIIANF